MQPYNVQSMAKLRVMALSCTLGEKKMKKKNMYAHVCAPAYFLKNERVSVIQMFYDSLLETNLTYSCIRLQRWLLARPKDL